MLRSHRATGRPLVAVRRRRRSPDGSRLHVAIPDITRRHVAVNIRKFRSGMRDLQRARAARIAHGAGAPSSCTRRVGGAQHPRLGGDPESARPHCSARCSPSARPEERIVTVEETFELALATDDWVALQCRQASLEGTGEVTLRRLVKEALRMRPDRLVVGEVREAESLDLLIALNSGLPGMC